MIYKFDSYGFCKWLFSENGYNLSSVLAWLNIIDVAFIYWQLNTDDYIQVVL